MAVPFDRHHVAQFDAAELGHTPDIVAAQIHEHQRIIAFRNILIHGYADVDDRVVWDVLQTKLPTLLREVEALLPQE